MTLYFTLFEYKYEYYVYANNDGGLVCMEDKNKFIEFWKDFYTMSFDDFSFLGVIAYKELNPVILGGKNFEEITDLLFEDPRSKHALIPFASTSKRTPIYAYKCTKDVSELYELGEKILK